MRRKDREMDREFGLRVIDNSNYGVVSMIDSEGFPYGIPLSIVRDDNTLYFHSAMGGKKVDILEKNKKVSVAFVGNTRIPENYTEKELDEFDESKAVLLISKVFTTEFESVVVRGSVELVLDREEKVRALRKICEKYTPSKMKYFDMGVRSGLDRVNIYSIEIEAITSKRKKYDKLGEEMKWGRMK